MNSASDSGARSSNAKKLRRLKKPPRVSPLRVACLASGDPEGLALRSSPYGVFSLVHSLSYTDARVEQRVADVGQGIEEDDRGAEQVFAFLKHNPLNPGNFWRKTLDESQDIVYTTGVLKGRTQQYRSSIAQR
jgi:hypothetical protein